MTAQFHYSETQGGAADLKALLEAHPQDTHFYCCGPAGMLDAFEQACAELGHVHSHLERFAALPKASEQEALPGYTAVLQRSGISVHVAPGASLLDAIEAAGVHLEYSCREGVCGACETRVISGDVDHRDHILSPQEQAANRSMMVCVSGCRSGQLVLDA